jgi:hypothetical protein
MRDEFCAVRGELATQIGAVREELRVQMGGVREELGGQITGLREDIEETRYMRALHEDVISRLAIIQEGQVTRRPPPRRQPK